MITGRCECGNVQYQIDGEITDYSHCHCSQCRRMHGAAFASFAGVAGNQFKYRSGESDLTVYNSSKSHKRVFCRVCGSNIRVDLSDYPDELYIAMGTMNDNPKLPPGYHIYVGSKAPWYEITDDLPRYYEEPEDD